MTRRRMLLWGVLLAAALTVLAVDRISRLPPRRLPPPPGDWPGWRYDAGRTASTPEELPPNLSLRWSRRLPALAPAWPDAPGMQFDETYQPVIADGTIYLGSSRDDSVTALDADSGAQRWRFLAGGPVRFAPYCWKGKVYAASDDGCLYCLDGADGRPLWKFRGAPDAGRMVLGNGRLMSTWPARGAPVAVEGTVYFAAGIWPFMGVFVHAVDAETGRRVWTNSGLGALYMLQPHDSPAFSGLAPQGYLAVGGDRLLVPNGRAVAAGLRRSDGGLLYFRHDENSRRGGYFLATRGALFFSNNKALRLSDGGSQGFCAGRPVLGDDAVYRSDADVQRRASFDPEDPPPVLPGPLRWAGERCEDRSELKLAGPDAPRILIEAGSRLYAARGTRVEALEIPPRSGGEPRVVWSAEAGGHAASMAAGGGRLVVATLEGAILCFAAPAGEAAPAEHEDRAGPALRHAGWAARLPSLLARSGASGGWAVLIGDESPEAAAELAALAPGMGCVCLVAGAERTAAARERLDAAGLNGSRVSVLEDGPGLRLPSYMAELLVVTGPEAASLSAGTLPGIFRVLRPYGGTAFLPEAMFADLPAAVREAGIEGAGVSRENGFWALSRVGPLPGAGQWSHQYADAANTVVSSDRLVRAPLGLLWFGGPSNERILPRHGHGPNPQAAGGRLLIEGPDVLRALDVYTGRLLWEAELPGLGRSFDNTRHQSGANTLGSNYVTQPDAIYVVHDGRCLRLDPATGKKAAEYALPADEAGGGAAAPVWGFLAVSGDVLLGGELPEGAGAKMGGYSWEGAASSRLVAMDRMSGRPLWQARARHSFRHNAIAAGGGRVYCVDRPTPQPGFFGTAAGAASLSAFDLRTGKVLWSTHRDVFAFWLGYSERHDVLVQAYRSSRDHPWEPGDAIAALRGRDGAPLWRRETKYHGPVLIRGDRLITQEGALSLLTGLPAARTSPLTGEESEGGWTWERGHGCSTMLGSGHLLTFRSGAASFLDLARDGGIASLGGFRSGCTSNLIVADGVLAAPDYTRTCSCGYQNQSSLGLIHDEGAEFWTLQPHAWDGAPVRRVGINLGAPGDRLADDGTLWLEWPDACGKRPALPVSAEPVRKLPSDVVPLNTGYAWPPDSDGWSAEPPKHAPETFRMHSSELEGDGLKWVAASGLRGVRRLSIGLGRGEERCYTVRLHFCEPDGLAAGARVFDVEIQGRAAISGLDVAREAGGGRRPLVRELRGVVVSETLEIVFRPAAGSAGAVISGVEVIREEQAPFGRHL